MTEKFNQYVGLSYDDKAFNCWHLASLVLFDLYNVQLPDVPDMSDREKCNTLPGPAEGALVLMYGHESHEPDHVGVCIDDRQVIHCHESSMTSLVNRVKALQKVFWKVEFYAVDHYSL